MSLLNAWKAAGIARMVERIIIPRMDAIMQRHYKSQFSWGTQVGNHIFDTVAKISKKNKYTPECELILSILFMYQQAINDGNEGGARGFEKLFQRIWPEVRSQISEDVVALVVVSSIRFE